MTASEIKDTYSMRDIVEKYGFHPNRAGFIHCPFHNGDRTASCKIYQKDFHCHACGKNGDVFTFVQKMEGCSFKEAYKMLGGSYEKQSDIRKNLFIHRKEQERKTRAVKLARLKHRRKDLYDELDLARAICEITYPFSDDWCWGVNRIEKVFRELDAVDEEIDELTRYKDDG